MRITVHHPEAAHRLTLRTAVDWEQPRPPNSVSGTAAVFDVPIPGTTLALKPCLEQDGELLWSQGPDYVLSAWEADPVLYPYFRGPTRGRVSDVLLVRGDDDAAHAVRIYHPPGYDENTLRRYPVLYMHDGQNLFFPDEAFAGNEWQVDETMDRLDEMNAIRKAIVVGIAPADRAKDYTQAGYDAYGSFVAERLKPLIDAHLRTLPGPSNNVVMGSSLGGVASLHLGWSYPESFGRVACLSSTFGVMDDLFDRIATQDRRELCIYLDSGWPNDNFERTNAMRDLLVRRGWRLGVDLMHFNFPGDHHNELAWSTRSHLPFQFFFGKAWRAARGEP